MRLALAGLGRMGTPIAGRLRSAGHSLAVFDLDPAARERLRADGFEVATSLAEAAGGAAACLLCLPDSKAVAAAVAGPAGLLAASPVPPLCIDLTSALPSATRALAPQLAAAGCSLVDSPLSGGVAGAGAGTLTAMLGGEPAAVAAAEPVLRAFASTLRHAGPLGAGDCVKALNNTLSAVSLTATSLAVAAAADPEAAVAAINSGLGRSQNSEVKFPRDILPGTYAAGFTAGLMLKDVLTACEIARELDRPAPMAEAMARHWTGLVERWGGAADFTRVHADAARTLRQSCTEYDLLDFAVAAACLAAAREEIGLAEAFGLVPDRVLEIVNASTGRSEATRHHVAGLPVDAARLAAGLALARSVCPHPLWDLAQGVV